MKAKAKLCCPECGSERFYRDGLRYHANGESVQRWLCRDCGLRFSKPLKKPQVTFKRNSKFFESKPKLSNFNTANTLTAKPVLKDSSLAICKDITPHECSQHNNPNDRYINTHTYNRDCQVGDLEKELKNLIATEQKQTVAGEKSTQQGKIIEYAWKLKKRNLSDNTIKIRTYQLNQLVNKGANLNDPDSVETILATERLTASQKANLVAAYSSYAKTMGIQWQPIKVNYKPKEPFIPLETELDQLIARCGKKTAAYLQVLKDTGARAGEARKLKWTDINEANMTISVNNPEKGSDTRTVKVSSKTIAMLKALPNKYDPYIFNPRSLSMKQAFQVARKRLVVRLHNPRFKQIHLHTFRHFKATMEYHKTKDLLHVMNILGHRNIQSTLRYTRYVNFENDEYHSATAKTVEKAKQLIEGGFEYVCDMEDIKLFRKRK